MTTSLPARAASTMARVANSPTFTTLALVAAAVSLTAGITIGDPYTVTTIQLCATGGPVCFPGGIDRSAHSSYKNNGMAEQAADFVAGRLGVSAPSTTLVQTAGEAEAGN